MQAEPFDQQDIFRDRYQQDIFRDRFDFNEALWTTYLKTLNSKIEKTKSRLKTLETERNELIRYTLIQCTGSWTQAGCNRKFHIKDLVFIQTRWYVEPYSCSGGDYWKDGEGQFECPGCGCSNKISRDSKDTDPRWHPGFYALKYHFKDITVREDR